MRKQVLLFALFFMIFSFTGCNQPAQENQQQVVNNNQIQQPTDENTLNTEEPMDMSNLSVDVNNYLDLLNKTDLSIEDCKTLGNQDLIEKCNVQVYLIQALAKLDEKICDKITIDESKADCKLQVKGEVESAQETTRSKAD